jgi:uncharacterized protein YecA (UPF0149 family)
MSKPRDAAGHARKPWRSGRASAPAASDVTDTQYGVPKPDVIEDFLRERALDNLFADRDEECPCGSGKSYYACHGSPVET